MTQLTKRDYEEVRTWIYENARPLDLNLWQYHFENGSSQDVVEILSLYQNEDGGFGKGLEPDSWARESTPYTTSFAIDILEEIEYLSSESPLVNPILDYLEASFDEQLGMWPFTLPFNDKYPHAPWWSYNKEENKIQSLGLTLHLLAFILKYGKNHEALYTKACHMTQGYLDNLEKETNFGESGLTGYMDVIESLFIHRINSFPVEKLTSIRSKLASLIYDSIEKDATKWGSYTIRPSRYIHTPKSYYYEAFLDMKELMEKECNYLIDTRKPQGVWDIPWSWFDLGHKYPKAFAISENRWKSYLTICHLRLLRAFGHLS